MAKGTVKIFLLATAFMAASLWIQAAGQSGCTTALVSLSPCLNYISGSSSNPSSSCCSQLARMVQSQPQCLCTLLSGGGSVLGISINKTQALALPAVCRVQTPPVSECNAGAGGPSGTPPQPPQAAPNPPTIPSATPGTPSSPNGTPNQTPAITVSPPGDGSQSTDIDSSDGRTNELVFSIFFSVLIFSLSVACFF